MDINVLRRNETMKGLRIKGFTLAAIGKQYGITRERVRQVVGPKPKQIIVPKPKLNQITRSIKKQNTAIESEWQYIYFIRCLHAVKIGMSSNPEKEL